MFNNKLKERIKDLERRIDLQEDMPKGERDFFTKNVHYIEDMVCIDGHIESVYYRFYSVSKNWSYKAFYFLKGTEPKCDSIKEYEDGRLEFIRNGVICNKKGNIIK